jgi:hypothetical protein
VFSAIAGAPAIAGGQPPPSPRASALFNEAYALKKRGDYARACPMFEESHRLAPKLTPLLNIADCEEHHGKLVSARGHFLEVVSQIPDTNDALRREAQARADALEARLPQLTIKLVFDAPANTVVRRDGVEVAAASLGASIPIDPGRYTITAEALGRETKTFPIQIKERERLQIFVAPGPAPAEGPRPEAPVSDPGRPGLRIAGGVVTAAGAVGIGLSGVFGALVIAAKNTVDKGCVNKFCEPDALAAGERGQVYSTVSTVAAVAGLAALGAGIGLLVASRSSPKAAATIVPFAHAGGAGAFVHGAF